MPLRTTSTPRVQLDLGGARVELGLARLGRQLVRCGAVQLLQRLRRRTNQSVSRPKMTAAMPPTMPPAMAPVLVLLLLSSSVEPAAALLLVEELAEDVVSAVPNQSVC